MKIPSRCKIYSINEGYTQYWDESVKQYIHKCKYPDEGKSGLNARYVGSMVADMHRTLKYGGIFIYPATTKNPSGKLRLQYECNPMAFIIEEAGGKSDSGGIATLDIVLTSFHQRTPIFIGSTENVDDYLAVKKACESK